MNINKKYRPAINFGIYVFLKEILLIILADIMPFRNKILINLFLLIDPLIITIILIYINKDAFKGKFKDFKKNINTYIPKMIRYYLCGVPCMILCTTFISFFSHELPINEQANENILAILPIYACLTDIIFGPICEEITFRSCYKPFFKNKTLFVIITSLIFGFIHVIFQGDYFNFLPFAALSIFFSLIYFETDNIYTSIFMHMFHNLLCIILLFL